MRLDTISLVLTLASTTSAALFSNPLSSLLGSTPTSEQHDIVKARLQIPDALKVDRYVSVKPEENFCTETNADAYWKAVLAAGSPREAIGRVLCDNAASFLQQISSADLMAISGQTPLQLENTVVALMVRRDTLQGLYSQAYMDQQFRQCFQDLKQQAAGKIDPNWPCSPDCSENSVRNSLKSFTESNAACKRVLEDQLAAFTEAVINGMKEKPELMDRDHKIRSAILEALDKTSQVSEWASEAFDTLRETQNLSTLTNIDLVLGRLEKSLKLLGKEELYTKALATYNKLNSLMKKPQ